MKNPIKYLTKRFKLWNEWRQCSLDPEPYKIFVLLGLAHSPSFEISYMPMIYFDDIP